MYAVFSCLQPSHSCSIMPFGAFVNPRMISAKSASERMQILLSKPCAGSQAFHRQFVRVPPLSRLKVKPRENEIAPLVRYQGFAFLDLDSIVNC